MAFATNSAVGGKRRFSCRRLSIVVVDIVVLVLSFRIARSRL
jgi:hypothetical protein